jgi:ribonuclease III
LNDPFRQLETAVNYRFSDPKLLVLALSHRSVGSSNNERLEFLGDSVLNAVISAQLFEQHVQLGEGALTRLRASLVNQASLAEIARDLALGGYLSLGAGELKSGGQRRASILADALEALIGAVYLDAGFESARAVILHLFKERLMAPVVQESLKDYKTRLQEALQARNLPLPVYSVEAIAGQGHQQLFRVHCRVETLGIHARGEAGNRRAAEQEAAQRIFELLADA